MIIILSDTWHAYLIASEKINIIIAFKPDKSYQLTLILEYNEHNQMIKRKSEERVFSTAFGTCI